MEEIEIKEIDIKNSPKTERLKIENDKLRDEWVSCCSKTDKNYLKYIIQISMGSSVMIFCMAQIIRGADSPEIYFSLLSGTLGLYLPHPQVKDN
jgi:hypothetical protein